MEPVQMRKMSKIRKCPSDQKFSGNSSGRDVGERQEGEKKVKKKRKRERGTRPEIIDGDPANHQPSRIRPQHQHLEWGRCSMSSLS